jgi:CheY-like chemotaxis protein/two-component sensor histidine kinase
MSRLLDDLLDVSRLSNSQMRLQKEPVTVGALVAMAVEATRSQIEQKRHRLSITHRDGAITLEADPVRMTQVLSNLVGNAAKYTDAGGTLSVESCVRDGNCVISVVDSGIGLEDTRNVFTMFTQEKAAIDRSEGGLGIGLALVKGLVELHGGWVRAHSPGLGQGSTFEVGLPHSASLKAGTDRPETTFKPIAKMSPKRVLIADDNSDAVTVLRDVLELMGHSVSVANDGVNALALGNEVRPEVAILDIGMPGLNGFELARSIRGQGWGHRAILIAATGWGHDEAKREALLAGFDGHLTKPFTVEQLEALLNQL